MKTSSRKSGATSSCSRLPINERSSTYDIYYVDLDESEVVNLSDHRAPDFNPSLTADGESLTWISWRHGNPEVYRQDGGDTVTRLTNDPGRDNHPRWSPDGERIAFLSNRTGGAMELFVMKADGTEPRCLSPMD